MRNTAMQQVNTKARVITALLLSFLITGIYMVIVYQKLPIVYDINDDVAMRNVAAGVITGEPDAHLIFVKYILGLVISGLYRMIPGYDWYGIVMIGTILFSFAMILYRGLVSEKIFIWKIGYAVLWILLFTCIGLQHIITFQWTVSAAIAGAAGIYLFYTGDTEDWFQTMLEEGISVFLLLLCLLIRDSVFLMVLPVAAVCFCWKYGSFHQHQRFWFRLKHLAVPLALLSGIVVTLGVEKAAYRSEEWKTFLAYNTDRSMIMDYYSLENYEENAEFYNSLGLSPEEVENLQRYSLYLTEDLYGDTMHRLAVNAKERQLQPYSRMDQVVMGAKKVWEHFRNENYAPVHLLSFVLALLALAGSWRKDKKQFFLSVLICGILTLLWLYLGFKGRIVERVGYSMYLVTCMSLLAVGFRVLFLGEKPVNSKVLLTAGTIISCTILAVLSCQKWEEVEQTGGWRSNYNQRFLDVNDYMAARPDNVYFMTTFSIETYTDNFTPKRDFSFSNLLSVGGWHTFSPLENEKNKKLGITDPKRDIVEKENVYVISLENVNLRYMDRYYESLYGAGYQGRELVDVLEFGDQVFEVYDFDAEE